MAGPEIVWRLKQKDLPDRSNKASEDGRHYPVSAEKLHE